MDTTIQEIGVGLAWIAGILVSLGTIGAFLNYVVVRPLRKYIKEVVVELSVPAQATAKQLETKNGRNAGEFIEDSANSLIAIRDELAQMNKTMTMLNERSLENRGLITSGHAEHVEHLLKYHTPQRTDGSA